MVNAQTFKRTRILFLVDASSSMTASWHAQDNRFSAASRIVNAIMDSMYAVNNEVEFALRVYGSQFPAQNKNCTDTKLEVPFNLQNAQQIKRRLQYISNLGCSPIAYSLQQASIEELASPGAYDYSFVLITDGGESCNGDICETYARLIKNRIKISPYIIGLDSNTNLLSYYECLGKYVAVSSPREIANAVKLIVDDNRPILSKPTTLNLETKFTNSTPLEQAIPPAIPQYGFKLLPMPVKRWLPLEKPLAVSGKYLAYRGQIQKPEFKIDVLPQDNLKLVNRVPFRFQYATAPFTKVPKKLKLRPSSGLPPQFIAQSEIETFAVKTIPVRFEYAATPKTIIPKKLTPRPFAGIPAQMAAEPEIETYTVRSLPIYLSKPNFKLVSKAATPKKYNLLKLELPESMKAEPPIPIYNIAAIAKAQAKSSTRFAASPQIGKSLSKVTPGIFPPELKATPEFKFPKLDVPMFRLGYMQPMQPQPRRIKLKNKQVEFIDRLLVKAENTTATTTQPKIVMAPTEPAKSKIKPVKVEPSDKTEVVLYFTDGKGKYYKTKPMCAILEPVSGKPVQTFMRDVLSNGEPEPIVTKAFGNAAIVVYDNNSKIVVRTDDITIEQGKRNVFEIIVGNGTLIIQYISKTAGPRRPVEYTATIRRLFSGEGFTDVRKRCSEVMQFEPGDYHIEIDVFPPSIHTTDIAFNSTTVIEIPQPGLLQFNNTEPLGPVRIYNQSAETFAYLTTINLNGNLAEQNLTIQPGVYIAYFRPAGAGRGTPEIPVKFVIKANRRTNIMLQDYGNKVIEPDMTGEPVYQETGIGGGTIKVISGGK